MGFYPAPPGWPADIPGMDVAGAVEAVGAGCTRFSVGDRVMAVVGGGGQAELLAVPERHLLPVPDGVAWEAAGGFPEVFTTAFDALFTQCGLAMGDRVCIHGAAGGVGMAGVQLASAAGATVVATVRNEALRPAVEALGPRITAVDPAGFEAHGPFDVVLELVGGVNLAGNVAALATGGRISIIGVGAGGTAEVDLLQLMQKRAVVRGSTLRARSFEEKATVARAVEHRVLPLLADGTVAVPVEATFPMAEAAAAYDRFAAGGKLGKIVLLP
jgi:NADPH:quinone reductase-like Zn-dependent oxidoreductase